MLLFITERTAGFHDLAVRLTEKGIFLYLCPFETALFLCDCKDIGGVVLDGAAHLAQAEALAARLHTLYPDMPIAALVEPDMSPCLPAIRLIRSRDKERLFSEILDFCTSVCGWRTHLSTQVLSLSEDPNQTYYMGYRLPLSKSQHRLLRFLFYRYPKPTAPDDILSLCFPESPLPLQSLSALVNKINQKAAEIDPRRLIISSRSSGYRLRDGI